MAKAGFWLRGAKGKLAGAVAQKGQNGTILREIVTPKNPKTEKQIYQRAVMATVMKAYSAGKIIFDHSIQGLEKGAKTQQHFISKNAELLRSLIAAEIAAGTTALNCNAAVVAPKSLYAVPNAYMISEGTYSQDFFRWEDSQKSFTIPSSEENETVAQYASRIGLVAGDIYTFVAIVIASNSPTFTVRGVETVTSGGYKPESQYPAVFAFVRLQVKDVSSVTTPAASAPLTTFFEVTASKNTTFNASSFIQGDLIDLVSIIDTGSFPPAIQNLGSLGCIRSRLDEDLRSTSFMNICSSVADRATKGMYGITSELALAAWRQGTDALGTSQKILESDTQGGFVQA